MPQTVTQLQALTASDRPRKLGLPAVPSAAGLSAPPLHPWSGGAQFVQLPGPMASNRPLGRWAASRGPSPGPALLPQKEPTAAVLMRNRCEPNSFSVKKPGYCTDGTA